jgi:hypothetical protein
MVGASPAPVIIAKTEELLQTASIQTNSWFLLFLRLYFPKEQL